MMKRLSAILAVLFLVAVMAVLPAAAAEDKILVVDDADLLTDAQESALNAKLNRYSDDKNCDIVIVTVPDLLHADFYFNGTVEDYADMFYETHGYAADGVLVLRVLDYDGYGTHRIQFSCSGKCMKRLTDDEQNEIIDDIADDLLFEDYDSAFDTLADEINDKLAVRLKGYMYPIAVGISFALAMLIMLAIKGKLKTVAMQRGASGYVRPGSMHLTASRDTYLYSNVTRTARESSSSSGSSRTSSGGGSHSGVGRNI